MSGHIITERRALPPPVAGRPASGKATTRVRSAATGFAGQATATRRTSRRTGADAPVARYAPRVSKQAVATMQEAYPALRPTTYAGRAAAAALKARHRAPAAVTAPHDGVAGPHAALAAAAAVPVATIGDRALLSIMALALVSFLLLIVALVVPSSVGLPLAGAGFIALLAARVSTALMGWPARARRLAPGRSSASG